MICKNLRYSYLALELMNLLSKVRNIDQPLQIFSQNLIESLLIKTKKLQDLLNTQNKKKLFSTQHQSTHQQKLLLKTNFWLSILKIQDLGNTMPKYLQLNQVWLFLKFQNRKDLISKNTDILLAQDFTICEESRKDQLGSSIYLIQIPFRKKSSIYRLEKLIQKRNSLRTCFQSSGPSNLHERRF